MNACCHSAKYVDTNLSFEKASIGICATTVSACTFGRHLKVNGVLAQEVISHHPPFNKVCMGYVAGVKKMCFYDFDDTVAVGQRQMFKHLLFLVLPCWRIRLHFCRWPQRPVPTSSCGRKTPRNSSGRPCRGRVPGKCVWPLLWRKRRWMLFVSFNWLLSRIASSISVLSLHFYLAFAPVT